MTPYKLKPRLTQTPPEISVKPCRRPVIKTHVNKPVLFFTVSRFLLNCGGKFNVKFSDRLTIKIHQAGSLQHVGLIIR
jgi:hypothetical protein